MKQFLYKTIYQPQINGVLRSVNKALYPILPAGIKLPPSGTLTLRNSRGEALKLKTNQTNYLTQLLFWEGHLNFEYTEIFIKLIKKVGSFYDIGANIGYYSLLAESENSQVKVVAFEPASGPLFYLKENVKANAFKNIRVEDLALSDREGEITFYEIKNKKYSYLEHNLQGESNAGSKTTERNFVPVNVRTTTLDQYVIAKKEGTIDLLKMDTEGTEHSILEHATMVLEEMKPIIICETLFDTIEAELEVILKRYGYEFYNHTEAGLEKVGSIQRSVDNGVRNCFFVHPSKFHLIEEFVV